VNPVRYPTPSERTDVVKPLPEAKRILKLAELRAELALHLDTRPPHHRINPLAAWIGKRDLLRMEIQLLESQVTNVWHPVEVAPV
jgi:hypothetical protein